MIGLSVVIPVYRSAESLEAVHKRLAGVLEGLGRPWEIVFVDDSGVDKRAWAVLERIQRSDPEHVVAIELMRNFGQHNALMCGFHHARGEFVITMDDDLQNPPEEIPRLLEAIESQNLDLVYGSIVEEKKHSSLRNLGSWMIIKFANYIFQNNIKGSSFRIIRRELVQSILTYNLNYTFIDGLLAWNTQSMAAIPVRHEKRAFGKSGYSLSKLLTLSLNMFTNFSLVPLQFVSVLGLVASGIGFLLGLYYLIAHFAGWINVSGYASLIVTVLIMGGFQLLALGVIGEYLGRVHLNMNRKPQFTVRKIVAGKLEK